MRCIYILFVVVLASCGNAQKTPPVSVIPYPNQITLLSGHYLVPHQLTIGYQNEALHDIAALFIRDQDIPAVMSVTTKQPDIQLILSGQEKSAEAYTLNISAQGISISSASVQGVFYGLQTLKQMLISSKNHTLPCLTIQDAPRFAWRGLMLDESRYFFGKKKVKQLLDMMSLQKLNVFHWHLTDVPGWRIEIKQYPLLTSIGSRGNDIDPEAPARFYSQDDIKEIVQYAAERFIQIVPEIDMPGHARAANRAYPEFSGGGSKTHPEFTFNPGYEGTYAYLTNILKEVSGLFPSPYIHLGGDEVHYGNGDWRTNKYVQQLMKKEKLNDLKSMEAYFVNRMADSIKSLGKTAIGWDEIVNHGLPASNCLVMWWRHDKTDNLQEALKKGYDVILCPRIPLYFDFDQDAKHQYGRKWRGAYCSPAQVYAYPPDTLVDLATHPTQVRGMQGNIWSERIQSDERLDFMTYPRMSALAEAAWTNAGTKNYAAFEDRLRPMLHYLQTKNIHYFNLFHPDLTPEPVGLFSKNIKKQK